MFGDVPWRRVLRAAATLALVYAVGVTILMFVLMIMGAEVRTLLHDLQYVLGPLSVTFAVMFGLAFVLLALARRAGFAALWILLAGLWTALLKWQGVVGLGGPFATWSILALPLYGIGVLGTSLSRSDGGARRSWLEPSVFGGWMLLALIGLVMIPRVGDVYVGSVGAAPFLLTLAWAVAPFIISAVAVRRIWVATRPVAAPT